MASARYQPTGACRCRCWASHWVGISLPGVIAEIIREEGDAGRLFNVLGIKL